VNNFDRIEMRSGVYFKIKWKILSNRNNCNIHLSLMILISENELCQEIDEYKIELNELKLE